MFVIHWRQRKRQGMVCVGGGKGGARQKYRHRVQRPATREVWVKKQSRPIADRDTMRFRMSNLLLNPNVAGLYVVQLDGTQSQVNVEAAKAQIAALLGK